MAMTKQISNKRPPSTRKYWPTCSVCMYMKGHKEFRNQVMLSTYFNPRGSETLMDVVHRHGDPFSSSLMYKHFKRHQYRDVARAEKAFLDYENSKVTLKDSTSIVQVVEGQVASEGQHEQGLDEFIKEGREKLARRELTINANSFLAAIKIKADIEKSTKDRRLDAFKTLRGAATGTERKG